MITIPEILKLKYPNARPIDDYQVGYSGGQFSISYWAVPNEPQPSMEEIIQFGIENDLQLRTIKVLEKRKIVYPPINEQLDMLYHDKIDGTTTWEDAIRQVKISHPKPTE